MLNTSNSRFPSWAKTASKVQRPFTHHQVLIWYYQEIILGKIALAIFNSLYIFWWSRIANNQPKMGKGFHLFKGHKASISLDFFTHTKSLTSPTFRHYFHSLKLIEHHNIPNLTTLHSNLTPPNFMSNKQQKMILELSPLLTFPSNNIFHYFTS